MIIETWALQVGDFTSFEHWNDFSDGRNYICCSNNCDQPLNVRVVQEAVVGRGG